MTILVIVAINSITNKNDSLRDFLFSFVWYSFLLKCKSCWTDIQTDIDLKYAIKSYSILLLGSKHEFNPLRNGHVSNVRNQI